MKTNNIVYGVIATLGLAVLLGTAVDATPEIDARIESGINDSYVFRNYLKSDNFTVKSKDGDVTLSGTVSEDYKKGLAHDAVAAQPGVKSVDNRLWVKKSETKENSDVWLAGKVKTALLYHRSVSGLNTEVDAKDGVVTLRGRAESQAQKDLAGEYAADVKGVKDVRNELVVSNDQKKRGFDERVDDASITAQAKLALLTHRSTSGFKIHVETKNGTVTLTGQAKNSAERDLAEKIVNDIKGVSSVSNQIAVE